MSTICIEVDHTPRVKCPPRDVPDDAPFSTAATCNGCKRTIGDDPLAYCPNAHHWRAYAWRLEDDIEGEEEWTS